MKFVNLSMLVMNLRVNACGTRRLKQSVTNSCLKINGSVEGNHRNSLLAGGLRKVLVRGYSNMSTFKLKHYTYTANVFWLSSTRTGSFCQHTMCPVHLEPLMLMASATLEHKVRSPGKLRHTVIWKTFKVVALPGRGFSWWKLMKIVLIVLGILCLSFSRNHDTVFIMLPYFQQLWVLVAQELDDFCQLASFVFWVLFCSSCEGD